MKRGSRARRRSQINVLEYVLNVLISENGERYYTTDVLGRT